MSSPSTTVSSNSWPVLIPLPDIRRKRHRGVGRFSHVRGIEDLPDRWLAGRRDDNRCRVEPRGFTAEFRSGAPGLRIRVEHHRDTGRIELEFEAHGEVTETLSGRARTWTEALRLVETTPRPRTARRFIEGLRDRYNVHYLDAGWWGLEPDPGVDGRHLTVACIVPVHRLPDAVRMMQGLRDDPRLSAPATARLGIGRSVARRLDRGGNPFCDRAVRKAEHRTARLLGLPTPTHAERERFDSLTTWISIPRMHYWLGVDVGEGDVSTVLAAMHEAAFVGHPRGDEFIDGLELTAVLTPILAGVRNMSWTIDDIRRDESLTVFGPLAPREEVPHARRRWAAVRAAVTVAEASSLALMHHLAHGGSPVLDRAGQDHS